MEKKECHRRLNLVKLALSQEDTSFFHSYQSGMVMKPVRLLCYMFLLAFLDLTVHSVQ